MAQEVIIEPATLVSSNKIEEFLDCVMEVERSAWSRELQASRDKFRSRLKVFPEGFFVAKVGGKIKGVTTSQITALEGSKIKTWNALTDSGTLRKSHKPSGNSLYVVSVGVANDVQGMGIGSKLIRSQVELTKKLGLKRLFLGGRIPGYDTYCKQKGDISVEEYLKLKNQKNESIDPEIRFYERQGLRVTKIVPRFEPDTSSRDYGVVMVWKNEQRLLKVTFSLEKEI